MDIVSILLFSLIFLIFLAIFALLKTMSSPFIKRFEMILKSQIQPLPQAPHSHVLKFLVDQRQGELLEIQHEVTDFKSTVYNHYIFLKLKTKSSLTVRLTDIMRRSNQRNFLQTLLPPLFELSSNSCP